MDSPQDEDHGALTTGPGESPLATKPLLQRVEASVNRVPGLRRVPLPAIGIILLIALLNAAVWVAVAIVLVSSKLTEISMGRAR